MPIQVRRSPFSEAVSLADCALAIGLPLARQEFLRQVEESNHDFAKFVSENFGGHESLAWAEYERHVRLVRRVCEVVERLGVTVVRQAGLSQLRKLFCSGSRVITIVSHWRMLTLRREDILNPQGLVSLLESKPISNPILVALAEAWRDASRRDPALSTVAAIPAEELRNLIEERLNPYVEAANTLYLRPADRHTEPDERWRELTRTGLESVLGETLLQRGRFIELCDGLRTLPEFVEAISPGFSGVLDLTFCHSAFAFEEIKRHRPDCLLIVNRFPATLAVRMLRYKLLVEVLAKNAQPFIPLANRIHKELGEAYDDSH